MVFRISFGSHLRAQDVARLRSYVHDSNHHILEASLRSTLVSDHYETYASFDAKHRNNLKRKFHDFLSPWRPLANLAEQGKLHREPMDDLFRNNVMAARLLLLSEENEDRLAHGAASIQIHFEPFSDENLIGVVRIGALENNLQWALKSGHYDEFIDYARRMLKEKKKHYATRNRDILALAEDLHALGSTCVSADLGSIHAHDFSALARAASIPIEIDKEDVVLNPVEQLIDHVAAGKNPERIPEEKIARGFVYGLVLRIFSNDYSATVHFLQHRSASDVKSLFKSIRDRPGHFYDVALAWVRSF